MVGGAGVDGKINVKIGEKISFKNENRIEVPNNIFVDEICNGDYEIWCSVAFCSVTLITSFSWKAVCWSDR
jgi:hypothetical protein